MEVAELGRGSVGLAFACLDALHAESDAITGRVQPMSMGLRMWSSAVQEPTLADLSECAADDDVGE